MDQQWYKSHGHPSHPRGQLIGQQFEIELIRDSLLVNSISVAALTLVIYDLILCFGREVSIIWGRWNNPRGRHSRRLYVILRYASVANLSWYVSVNMSSNLSATFCRVWYHAIVINSTIMTLLPDAMMLIRINAVYDWQAPYVLITALLFFVQLTTSLAIGFAYVSSSTVLAPGSLLIPGCPIITSKLPPIFTFAAWIPSIIAQCIYFALMLKMFINVLCSLDDNGRPSLKSLREMRALIPTMMIFIRHGFIYFILAISAKFANAFTILSLSGPMKGLGIPLMMALYPIVITRLKLDLGEFMHEFQPPSTLNTPSLRSMTFSHSFIQPSLHWESGSIIFASRTSLAFSNQSQVASLALSRALWLDP